MFVATVGRRWRGCVCVCVWRGGGGQTPVLCPVTQNLTRVCPPLHVSSAANHETHVRRSPFPRPLQRLGQFSSFSMLGVIKVFLFGRAEKQKMSIGLHSLPSPPHYASLSSPSFLSLLLPPSFLPPLNPSASCRSVRLPVSVPIRFHLIHVTSINTQSSPDKSRPLSPPSASPVLLCITQFFPTSSLCHSRWSQCVNSHAGCTSR